MPGLPTLELFSDLDLIHLARQGDRRAFSELVCRYHQGVHRVVYRMCGDPDLANDAAQEAFLKAWQRLHQYKSQYSFRSWIYQIAIHVAIDVLRAERPQVDFESLQIPSESSSPEHCMEEQERVEMVRRAILALPTNGRAVVVLREYEGLSYQEISTALGIPLGTVMSRLNYARSQLRQCLVACLEG